MKFGSIAGGSKTYTTTNVARNSIPTIALQTKPKCNRERSKTIIKSIIAIKIILVINFDPYFSPVRIFF